MSATIHIETGGLAALAVRLSEVVASFPVTEQLMLTAAGEKVRDAAKDRAAESQKTAPTIRVLPVPPVAGRQAVAIGAGNSGGSILPLLLEGGNGAKFTQWNHPVFGNTNVIVTQQTRPYLLPALKDSSREITAVAEQAVEKVLMEELDEEFSG